MAIPAGQKATIVKTPAGDFPLQEGEEVSVLRLEQDPKSRWYIRVARRDGLEGLLRPFFVGQVRRADAPRLPNLRDVTQIVQELNFWQRIWENVGPRKAGAMKRMADWISSGFHEQKGTLPASVLRDAWGKYQKERKEKGSPGR